MSFDYKVEPPYPIESKVTLQNGNILKAQVIYIESRGCMIEMTAPSLKAGDKVTVEFNLPDEANTALNEISIIVKIYIQFKDGKPHYMAELHFKKSTEETGKMIERFLHEVATKKSKQSVKSLFDKK